jgi:hypothetical protein
MTIFHHFLSQKWLILALFVPELGNGSQILIWNFIAICTMGDFKVGVNYTNFEITHCMLDLTLLI